MTCSFGTRISIATLITAHPLVSGCLWVKLTVSLTLDERIYRSFWITLMDQCWNICKCVSLYSYACIDELWDIGRHRDDIVRHDDVIKWKHFRITGPLCGEFTGPGEFPAQRSLTRSFDCFLDLRPNKRLSKEPWDWWFETPSWSLWRQF